MTRHLALVSLLRSLILLVLLAIICASGRTQQLQAATSLMPVPPGLTLPVRIVHSLRAGAAKAGIPVTAITSQRIPISDKLFLPPGIEVLGRVIASREGGGQPAVLTLRFSSLRYRKQTLPIATRALAVANFTNVSDTEDPVNGGGDRGTPSRADWTTTQVGGDVLTRSGWIGVLTDGATQRVGFADFNGVYADPAPASIGAAAIPRAVGVFSTTAHGLYGFDEGARLESAAGDLTIRSPHKLVLRSGDALLLEALPMR